LGLIDTHTHLYLPEFDADRQKVVQNALDAGIQKMFLPNIDSGTIEGMLRLAGEFPGIIFPMIGLHPGSVRTDYLVEIAVIREMAVEGGFIAIGEIGIDLYWDKSCVSQQLDAFEKQIELAKELDLPIVIHARESFQEIFKVLDRCADEHLKGVFHSFTGGLAEAEKILSYDFYIGINGIATFKKSTLDKVVNEIPLKRLLLETDSPYLSPVPKRGIRNESSHLIYINQFLAKVLKISTDELAVLTSNNALELFKLN